METGKFTIAFKVKPKNGLLQDFIDKQGWSQNDFARAVGVTPSVAGRWFNMKDFPRKKETVDKIQKLTGHLIEDLFPEALKSEGFQKRNKEITFYREFDQQLLARKDVEQIAYTSDDATEVREIQDKIKKALSTLTPREQAVLQMRFGLDGNEGKTLEEVGAYFDVTQERIRQTEAKALRKLRHTSRSLYFKEA